MAVTAEDRQGLFKKLVEGGADPKEAAKSAGIEVPKTKPEPAKEVAPPVEASTKPRGIPNIGAKGAMSTTKSQRIIFGVVLFATAMTILGDVLAGRTSITDAIPRRVAAGTIAGIMLMLLAIPVPRLAASLAGVIGVASLFVNPNGQKVLEAISKIGGGSTSTLSGAEANKLLDKFDPIKQRQAAPPPITPGQPS